MNGFALGLGLKRRLRATRKWATETKFLSVQANDSGLVAADRSRSYPAKCDWQIRYHRELRGKT